LVRWVRNLLGRYEPMPPASPILGSLRRQCAGIEAIPYYLDSRTIREILARSGSYNKLQIWALFTLTSTIAAYTDPQAGRETFPEGDYV